MPHAGFNAANYAPASVVQSLAGGSVSGTFSVSHTATPVAGGIDLSYTLTNVSGQHQNWPMFVLGTGWNSDGGADPLTRVWFSKHRFKPDDSVLPWATQWSRQYGVGNVYSACIALDNGSDGDTTVGCATDYPHMFDMSLLTWRPNAITFRPNLPQINVRRVVPDFFAPGESKTIRFWLRAVAGIGDEPAVDSVSPYVAHIAATYPYDPHVLPRYRVLGLNVGQHEASTARDDQGNIIWDGTRQYWPLPTLRADEFSGWYAMLDALVNYRCGSPAALLAKGYGEVLLWAPTGVNSDSPGNFFPSIIRNLPDNLRSTLHEVPQWTADRGVQVSLWAGHGYSAVQYGDWHSERNHPLADGRYEAEYVNGSPTGNFLKVTGGMETGPRPQIAVADMRPWRLDPAAVEEFEANLAEALRYFNGVGLDAIPEVVYDPWIEDVLRSLRARFPTKWIAGETYKTDRMFGMVPIFYFGNQTRPSGFTGYAPDAYDGRCPLLERMYPAHRSMVYTSWNSNDAAMAADIQAIEADDMVPVVSSIDIETPSNLPSRSIVVRRDGRDDDLPWGGAPVEMVRPGRGAPAQITLKVRSAGGTVAYQGATAAGGVSVESQPANGTLMNTSVFHSVVVNFDTSEAGVRTGLLRIAHSGPEGDFVLPLRWIVGGDRRRRDTRSVHGSPYRPGLRISGE